MHIAYVISSCDYPEMYYICELKMIFRSIVYGDIYKYLIQDEKQSVFLNSLLAY